MKYSGHEKEENTFIYRVPILCYYCASRKRYSGAQDIVPALVELTIFQKDKPEKKVIRKCEEQGGSVTGAPRKMRFLL